MSGIRNHKFYTIKLEVNRQVWSYDEFGNRAAEKLERKDIILNVVAPSQTLAIAWAMEKESFSSPEPVNITIQEIHGFVQEHIW